MKQVFCFLSSHKFFGIAELWLKILAKRKGKRAIQLRTLLLANYLSRKIDMSFDPFDLSLMSIKMKAEEFNPLGYV